MLLYIFKKAMENKQGKQIQQIVRRHKHNNFVKDTLKINCINLQQISYDLEFQTGQPVLSLLIPSFFRPHFSSKNNSVPKFLPSPCIVFSFVINIAMIAGPTCNLDHCPSDRVCIHPECSSPAFICRFNQACESLHRHCSSPTSQTTAWLDIDHLNNSIFKKTDDHIGMTLKDVTEKVETIIVEMRMTLTRYVERLNEIRVGLRLRPEVAEVRNKLNAGAYSKIVGREMGVFAEMLRDNNQFQNKQHLLVAIAQLNEKGYKLIQSIRKRISDFLNRGGNQHDQKNDDNHSNEDKLAKLTSKIKKDPNNPERFFQRGLQHSKLGKLREAEQDYSKAISIDPNYIDARLNRGIIYYNSNRFNEAQQDYNLALQLDPTNSKAYNNRGRLFHDCRKIDKAEEDYKKAISLNPEFVKCYLNRAILYNQSHRLKDAENDYTRVIELQPNNAKAFANRGLLKFHQGRYEESEADYNKALDLDPSNDGTLNNRGYLYYTLGNYEKALADYNKAIVIKQKSLYYKNRSDTYLKLGRSAEAEEDLKKAKQIKRSSIIM